MRGEMQDEFDEAGFIVGAICVLCIALLVFASIVTLFLAFVTTAATR